MDMDSKEDRDVNDNDDEGSQQIYLPLELEMILSQILNLLPLSDLTTCRLVSTKWNEHALKILKRKRPIVIQFKSTRQVRLRGYMINSCYKLVKEFTSVMKSSSDIPFCSYKLLNINIDSPIVKEFFQICGNSIRELTLDLAKIKFVKSVQFKSLLTTHAPNLEVLDIDYLPALVTNPRTNDLFLADESEDNSNTRSHFLSLKKISFPACENYFCPEFWARIFKASINLEEINMNYAEQTTSLLQALDDSGTFGQLTALRLEYITETHLDLLFSANLPLSNFKFNVICNKVSGKKLEQLLKKLSPRLTVLAMGSPSKNGKLRIKLPKMPKLKRLGMFHCDDSLITLESIKFSEDTPSLQALEVSSGIRNFDWQDYLSVTSNVESSCNSVQQLTIGLLVADPQCVHFLGKTFPNVKKLSLEFPRRDFLQAVWTTWENLEELNLYFHVNNDDSKDRFICQIPTDWKESIKRKYDLSSPNWWENVDYDLPEMDSVCNLKSLQRLTIEQSPNSGTISDLTDFSVFFGFARLNNLRVLRIGRSQISPLGQQFLWTKLPMLSQLDVRDERGPGVFSSEEREELVSYIKYYEDNEEYNEQE